MKNILPLKSNTWLNTAKEMFDYTQKENKECGTSITEDGVNKIIFGDKDTVNISSVAQNCLASIHTHPSDAITFSLNDLLADMAHNNKYGVVVKSNGKIDIVEYHHSMNTPVFMEENRIYDIAEKFLKECHATMDDTNTDATLREKMMKEIGAKTSLFTLYPDAYEIEVTP